MGKLFTALFGLLLLAGQTQAASNSTLVRSNTQECVWSYVPGQPLTERPDTLNPQGLFLEWDDTDFRICQDLIQPVRVFYIVVPFGTIPRVTILSSRSHDVGEGLPGRPDTAVVQSAQPSAGWVELVHVETWRGFRLARVEVFPQIGDRVHSEILEELQLSVTFTGSPAPAAAYPRNAELLKSLALNGAISATWWQQVRRQSHLDEGTTWPAFDLTRVAVTETGLYEIRGTWLGANTLINQPSTKIRMFGNGGRLLPITVGPVDSTLHEIAIIVEDGGDGIFDRNDRILFFGRALKGADYCDGTYMSGQAHQSPFSTENVYFLGVDPLGADGLRMAPLATSGGGTPVTTTAAREYLDQDVFIFSDTAQRESGLVWLMTTIDPYSQRTFNLSLDAATGAAGEIRLDAENEGSVTSFGISVGSTELQNVVYSSSPFSVAIPQGVLQPGGNAVTLYNRSGAKIHLNYIEITFQRRLAAPAGLLEFFAPSGQTGLYSYTVEDLASDGYILEITDPLVPRVARGGVVVDSSTAQAQRRYLASSVSRIRTPISRGTKAAQASGLDYTQLRDPNNSAGLILLTYDDGYDILDSLKQFHATYAEEPLVTMRVRLTDVFDEFSWGVRDPVAIRDFLKYAYDNWQGQPKYVLLIGDGDYDYRNITSNSDANWMPPWEYRDLCRDDFYVQFDNFSTIPWIAIGRWPVQSNDELQAVISKTIAYANTPLYGPWKNTVTFATDDEWKSGTCGSAAEKEHTRVAESLINTVLPKYFTFKKIYEIFYPFHSSATGAIKPDASRDLIEAINRGTLIVSFAGHGNERIWTDEQMFVMDRDRNLLDNYRMWPMFLAATCTWGGFDRPIGRCFPEILLADSRDGSIACVGATRFTYIGSNNAFTHKFYQELFLPGLAARRSFGEALLLAKAQGFNASLYHLFGNPVLRLATPEYFARVTASDDSLRALSLFHVAGEITRVQDGPAWEDFQGIVEARVYDTEDSATYYWCGNTAGDRLYYGLPGNAIFRGTASITNGHFDVTFRVPRDVRYGGNNAKISLYFYGDGTGVPDSSDGIGIEEHLQIASVASSEQDSLPPAISAWMEVPSFHSGDLVSATPKLHVDLVDSSGINLSGEVGHRIAVRIDDAQTEDLTAYFNYALDRYTVGSLEKTIGPLAEGEHRLIIEAWDSFNNLNQATLTFMVGQSGTAGYAIRDLLNFPNPMTGQTAFTYFLTQGGTRRVSLKIFTLSGKLIYEMDGLGTKALYNSNADRLWDGRDRAGHLLANGVYFYRLTAEHENGHSAEATGKLVILR